MKIKLQTQNWSLFKHHDHQQRIQFVIAKLRIKLNSCLYVLDFLLIIIFSFPDFPAWKQFKQPSPANPPWIFALWIWRNPSSLWHGNLGPDVTWSRLQWWKWLYSHFLQCNARETHILQSGKRMLTQADEEVRPALSGPPSQRSISIFDLGLLRVK